MERDTTAAEAARLAPPEAAALLALLPDDDVVTVLRAMSPSAAEDVLVALGQVVDDALRGRQLVGGLLAHPLGEARQIVRREPDRHRQVLVGRPEFQFQMLVQTLQKVGMHGS